MKEDKLKDILNQSEANYELKQEYLDDLTNKLNNQRPPNKKGVYGYLGALLLLLFVGTCLFYPNENLKQLDNKNINEKLVVLEADKLKTNNHEKDNATDKELINTKEIEKDESKNLVSIIEENQQPTYSNKEVKRSIDFDEEGKEIIENSFKRVDFKTKPFENFAENTVNPSIQIPENLNDKAQSKINQFETNKSKKEENPIKISDSLINDNPINMNVESITANETLVNNSEDTTSQKFPKNNAVIDSNNLMVESKDSIKEEKVIPVDDTLRIKNSASSIVKLDTLQMNLDSSALKYKWQVSLMPGVNTSFSRFTNASNQEYGNKRINEEKCLVSFSGGIMAERFITNKLKIVTGLNYISYGSNNEYSPSSVFSNSKQFNGFDSTYNTLIDSIYYTPTRMWVPYLVRSDTSIDSSFVDKKVLNEDSTAFLSRGKSSFSYVELPLMIGYYKTINKWNVGFNSGVSLGLLTRSSGYYITEDLRAVQVAQSQQVMWNFLLSPEINYQFKENIYVGFQPFLRVGLNNLSITEPIDRSYYSLQFNAKIGMRF